MKSTTSKRILSLLLVFVLALGLLPAGALAAEEKSLTIATAACTEVGTYDDDYPVYLYVGAAADVTQIVFSDFAATMEDGMISSTSGNAYVEGTHKAPLSSGYAMDASDEGWAFDISYESGYFDGCYAYWLMDDNYEMYYFILKLSADLFGENPFYPSVGSVYSRTEDGYRYPETDYTVEPPTSVEKTIDLYTVKVPFGTSAVTLNFKPDDPRIAYSYNAAGEYIAACAESGSYAQGGQTGERAAVVRADKNGVLPDFVRVQTPYNESWASETLYAVEFEYTNVFTASVGGVELTDITYTPGAYEYYDWMTGKAVTVPVYAVTVPCGAKTVDLAFTDSSLVYNYDCAGEYLSGWYTPEKAMAGERATSVTIDTNGDDAADYIQVQNIYSVYDNSTYTYVGGELYYAVTFRYFTAETNGGAALDVSLTDVTYTSTYPAATVPVYSVTLPEGEDETVLRFADNVLVYNYAGDGTWLAGNYEEDALHTGVRQATVSADSDDDEIMDYLLVQKPFDAEYNTELWFAITFGEAFGGAGGGGAAADVDPATLMDGIAAGYTGRSGEWVIMDMAAYEDLKPSTSSKTTDAAKQTYINNAISSLTADNVGDTAYDKAIISLTALGVNAEKLYAVNSNTSFSAIAGLNGVTKSSSVWNAPYTLAAYHQGNYDSESFETALVEAVLGAQAQAGSWTEYGDSIQSTANMIAGLAFYYDTDSTVKAAVDKAIKYLSSAQKADGSFDAYGHGADANTAATVVIALSSVGINPDTDARFVKNGVSALDALMSFALDHNSGFGYQNNTTLNPTATEQGFRALIAAAHVMDDGKAFNIYDFSHNTSLTPGRATGTGSVQAPAEPVSTETMTVYLTMKSDFAFWLTRRALTVPTDAKVYHAFVQACDAAGITYVGAQSGYVRSITKNGTTLAEFTKGPNSGWLYKVNGELPQVSLTDCDLTAGDEIVWYYTEDWTKDSSAGAFMAATSEIAPYASVSGDSAFASVTDSQVAKAIAAANKAGDAAITISPKNTGSAAQISVTIPTSAAQSIVDDSDAALVVETTSGSVDIQNDALAAITQQAEGRGIEIIVEQKAAADVKDETIDTTDAIIVDITVKSGDKEITEFGGKALTIRIPVTGSFVEGESYKVIQLSSGGTKQTLIGKCVKADGKLAVQVSVKGLSTFVVLNQKALPFTDVDGHWGFDAIKYAFENGLMEGDGDKFDPEGALSRAMLVTILYRLEKQPAVTSANPFTDVLAGQWYTNAVIWAAENKIVDGYDNGLFGPNDKIAREQMAAMLWRYAKYKNYDVSVGENTNILSYHDAKSISEYAIPAMQWACGAGLIKGDAGSLMPVDDASRAEATTILMRFIESLTKKI